MKAIAVVLAGGFGLRSGFSRPKQIVKLGGRPVIAHTLQQFQGHPGISEIAVVLNNDCLHEVENLVMRERFTKVRKLLLGGTERYQSSLAAIRAYEDEAGHEDIRLLFHDAVRPFVSHRIISDVLGALEGYGSVDTATPAVDTVVRVDPRTNTIEDVPDRNLLRFGQTPQGFHYRVIKEAYDRALEDPHFKTTDDCGVVLKYAPQYKTFVVEGEPSNRKLTYSDDLLVMDKLLQTNAGRSFKEGGEQIALSTLKERTVIVFGGTSGIGASISRMASEFGANVVSIGRSSGVDITKPSDVRRLLEQTSRTFGRVDAVVNTAGILSRQPLANMSAHDIDTDIRTNFLGPVTIASISHEFLRQTRGHLLFFSSSSYTYGRAFYSTYSASKAAVVNLTQALADEWNDDGIKVNCVNPARAKTPMRTKAFGMEPEGSLLDPDEIAMKSLSILTGDTSGLVYDIVRH